MLLCEEEREFGTKGACSLNMSDTLCRGTRTVDRDVCDCILSSTGVSGGPSSSPFSRPFGRPFVALYVELAWLEVLPVRRRDTGMRVPFGAFAGEIERV